METTTVSDDVRDRGNRGDAEYEAFLRRLDMRFLARLGDVGAAPLFKTDAGVPQGADSDRATGLWEVYLTSFEDPAVRQYHNCNACRHFIERFGGLVTIAADGTTSPAIWDEDDAPEEYREAVSRMARLVRKARVKNVFLSPLVVLGEPVTGPWRHLAVSQPVRRVFRSLTQTAPQAIAEKHEDFVNVVRALGEFTPAVLDQALSLLRADALYNSEKVLGQAEWLRAIHTARDGALDAERRRNVTWLAVATAPAGFCHPRASMIGTLLSDLALGLDFGEVSRRFADKMHPLLYRRPQAAPKEGAIEQAEKIVEQLGVAGALRRRYARLDEVQAIWRPRAAEPAPPSGGVFDHLKRGAAEGPAEVKGAPARKMTWEKFAREILPTAERIELCAPRLGPYTALVTAVDPEAPPILQWDAPDRRNPVSWYFWQGGASAQQFGLTNGAWVEVDAVTLKPSMWNGGFEHQGAAVMFVLHGARDSRKPSAGLFPSMLRSELHGVRSVIEAYSQKATIENPEESTAAGVMYAKGDPREIGEWQLELRVTAGGARARFELDRWD